MRLSSASPLAPAAPDRFLLEPSVVSRAATGEAEDFDHIYCLFKPLVSSVARRVLGDSEDVNDVVQETMYQVYRQAGRYDHARGSVAAWVSTIAKSRSLDRQRAQLKRVTAMELHHKLHVRTVEGSGVDAIDQREQSIRLSAALKELPEAQRQLLELSYGSDYSHSQIAERLALPLGTVKTRIRTALRRLRQSLSPAPQPVVRCPLSHGTGCG